MYDMLEMWQALHTTPVLPDVISGDTNFSGLL